MKPMVVLNGECMTAVEDAADSATPSGKETVSRNAIMQIVVIVAIETSIIFITYKPINDLKNLTTGGSTYRDAK